MSKNMTRVQDLGLMIRMNQYCNNRWSRTGIPFESKDDYDEIMKQVAEGTITIEAAD